MATIAVKLVEMLFKEASQKTPKSSVILGVLHKLDKKNSKGLSQQTAKKGAPTGKGYELLEELK